MISVGLQSVEVNIFVLYWLWSGKGTVSNSAEENENWKYLTILDNRSFSRVSVRDLSFQSILNLFASPSVHIYIRGRVYAGFYPTAISCQY